MKQKPKNIDENGCEISEVNGTRTYRDLIRINELTKYDLRNYSEKDALALRIAHLADKTWHREYIRYGSSSLDGQPKIIGNPYRKGGKSKPLLNLMLERVTSLLKRKYSENPEGLKDLISECDLDEYEFDYCIRKHKKDHPFLNTSSISDIENNPWFNNNFQYIEDPIEREKEIRSNKDYWIRYRTIKPEGMGDKKNCALRIGRLYLSDIAKRAYSELIGDNSFSKEDSFVERILPSKPKKSDVPNIRYDIPENQRALWGIKIYDYY